MELVLTSEVTHPETIHYGWQRPYRTMCVLIISRQPKYYVRPLNYFISLVRWDPNMYNQGPTCTGP